MDMESTSAFSPIDYVEELRLQSVERRALIRSLGLEDDGPEFGKRLAVLAQLALEEWVDWIVGRHRFNSVSENDKARVLRLFLDVRKEPPTLQVLVNDLGIPEGRGTSMLSRMRYGDARRLRALGYRKTHSDLSGRLQGDEESGGRKTLFIEKQSWDYIQEAAWEIMRDTAKHAKGQQYEGAEFPEGSVDRWGGTCKASVGMWDYILDWLDQRATEGGM